MVAGLQRQQARRERGIEVVGRLAGNRTEQRPRLGQALLRSIEPREVDPGFGSARVGLDERLERDDRLGVRTPREHLRLEQGREFPLGREAPCLPRLAQREVEFAGVPCRLGNGEPRFAQRGVRRRQFAHHGEHSRTIGLLGEQRPQLQEAAADVLALGGQQPLQVGPREIDLPCVEVQGHQRLARLHRAFVHGHPQLGGVQRRLERARPDRKLGRALRDPRVAGRPRQRSHGGHRHVRAAALRGDLRQHVLEQHLPGEVLARQRGLGQPGLATAGGRSVRGHARRRRGSRLGESHVIGRGARAVAWRRGAALGPLGRVRLRLRASAGLGADGRDVGGKGLKRDRKGGRLDTGRNRRGRPGRHRGGCDRPCRPGHADHPQTGGGQRGDRCPQPGRSCRCAIACSRGRRTPTAAHRIARFRAPRPECRDAGGPCTCAVCRPWGARSGDTAGREARGARHGFVHVSAQFRYICPPSQGGRRCSSSRNCSRAPRPGNNRQRACVQVSGRSKTLRTVGRRPFAVRLSSMPRRRARASPPPSLPRNRCPA